MKLTPQQEALLDFVVLQHGDQKRKYIGTPYWEHPLAVAHIVDAWCKLDLVIEIALCHDLLEDTECGGPELEAKLLEIGYDEGDTQFIRTGVWYLTDQYTKEAYPEMNRAERKQQEAARLRSATQSAKAVKLADLIHNTDSIVEHDPGFAKVYLKEKRDMINVLRDGPLDLVIACCHTYFEAIKKLEKTSNPA